MSSIAEVLPLQQLPRSVGSVAERDQLVEMLSGCRDGAGPSADVWLKIQPFKAGGFEAVVRWKDDAESVPPLPWDTEGDAPSPFTLRRIAPLIRSENSIESSRMRAKKMIRYHCKNMGADHLTTCTTREESNTPDKLWLMWGRARRRYEHKTGRPFPCVVVPEQHPTNPEHWHLHIAHPGKLNLALFRPIWWVVCGGRGMGNVDVRYIKVRGAELGGKQWAADKVARYISKYVTKALMNSERFNKRRYSVSDSRLEKAGFIKLDARSLDEGMREACGRLGLNHDYLHLERGCVWAAPGGSLIWFQVPPAADCLNALHDPPPF